MSNRMLGILMIVTGLASLPILEGDATAAFLLVPAGLCLLVTGGEVAEEDYE